MTGVIASWKKSVGVIASSGQNSWVFDTLYVCLSEGQMLTGVTAISPNASQSTDIHAFRRHTRSLLLWSHLCGLRLSTFTKKP